MPMWPCDSKGCARPALRSLGNCIFCKRHLCSSHVKPEVHACPNWQDVETWIPAAYDAERNEINALLGRINTDALAARASSLRGGMRCVIPPLSYDKQNRSSVMGGMNYHVPITFGDGVRWIARMRRSNAYSAPEPLRDYIMQSEVATLRFLERTNVPAPKVFDFAVESDPGNDVGAGYILMEMLPGKALRLPLAKGKPRERLMAQLADVYSELRRFPFDSAGSLDLPGSPTHVGPVARELMTDFVDDGPRFRPLGPHTSVRGHYVDLINLVLSLIARDEIYSARAVDSYLIHRYLLDHVSAVENQGRFFLKHADDKGDHILVDDQGNITGIIDWEWAFITSPAAAFKSPTAFLDGDGFYAGKTELGENEAAFAHVLDKKGHHELAGYVRHGMVQQMFDFCCGYSDMSDWKTILSVFRGLRDLLEPDRKLGWEEWRDQALRRYGNEAEFLRIAPGG